MFDLSTRWVSAQIVIAFPILRRSIRPRRESTATVRTYVVEDLVDAVCAKGALVRADARLR